MLQSFSSDVAFRGLSRAPFDGSQPCVLGKRTLIYGRNGSGKTSLTEAMRLTQSGGQADGVTLKARVVVGDVVSTFDMASATPFRLFVYNRFYVQEALHLFLDGEGQAVPILRLGKKNVEAERELRESRLYAAVLGQRQSGLQRTGRSIREDLNTIEQRTKAEIVSTLGAINGARYNTASFRVDAVRKLLRDESNVLLEDDDFNSELIAAGIPSLPHIDLAAAPQMAEKLHERINTDLLGVVVESVQVARLANTPALSDWVEKGVALHQAGDLCGFCQVGTVAAQILDTYRQHFSEALQTLREGLKKAVAELERQQSTLETWISAVPKEASFLPDYRERARYERGVIETAVVDLDSALGNAIKAIELRLADPLTPLPESQQLQNAFPIVDTEALSRLVAENNAACSSQADRSKRAKAAIEAHFGATSGEAYRSLGSRLERADRAEDTLTKRIRTVEARIFDVQQSLQDVGQIANRIDADLGEHFGHAHLRVSVSADGKGYVVTRAGELARHISEGERNAIALIYFLRSLEEDGVDASNTVVVIDDPVTSMDKEALFAAFAFEKKQTSEFAQTIVLTHDYEYFRLHLRDLKSRWDKSQKRMREGSTKEERMPAVSFLELRAVSDFSQDSRCSEAREMPRSLLQHPSEYHMLFLHVAEAVAGKSQEYLPLVGNAGRRLLEGFLSFRAPHKINFQEKVDAVAAAASIDHVLKERVVRFLHSQSHREEPRPSAALDFPSIEAELVTTLRFIQQADGSHFDDMCAAVDIDPETLLNELAALTGS